MNVSSAVERPLDAGRQDEGAAPAGPFEATLAGELVERAPDGDQAAAVATGQLAFGWESVARLPLAGVDGGLQVQVDLVVQRDGTELQSVARHGSLGSSSTGALFPARELITL